jgi:hypothetical protein
MARRMPGVTACGSAAIRAVPSISAEAVGEA